VQREKKHTTKKRLPQSDGNPKGARYKGPGLEGDSRTNSEMDGGSKLRTWEQAGDQKPNGFS